MEDNKGSDAPNAKIEAEPPASLALRRTVGRAPKKCKKRFDQVCVILSPRAIKATWIICMGIELSSGIFNLFS